MIVKLPVFIDPMLSLLPRYAHPLSILLLNKTQNYPILLNDFSQLAYDCESGNLYNPDYDWMYTNCGALTYECGIFPMALLRESHIIINFIAAMLQNGRYCIIDIDEYYCSFSIRYSKEHSINGVLVSGLDTTAKVLFINSYSESSGYQEFKINTDEFLKAMDFHRSQIVIHCFRENKNYLPQVFDKTTFIKMVKKHESAEPLLASAQAKYQYGSSAIRTIADRIRSKEVDSEWLRASMLSLREHKVIMLNRILWLCERKELDDSLYDFYQSITNLADDAYGFSVQYERETRQILHGGNQFMDSNEKSQYKLLIDAANVIMRLIEKEKGFFELITTKTER